MDVQVVWQKTPEPADQRGSKTSQSNSINQFIYLPTHTAFFRFLSQWLCVYLSQCCVEPTCPDSCGILSYHGGSRTPSLEQRWQQRSCVFGWLLVPVVKQPKEMLSMICCIMDGWMEGTFHGNHLRFILLAPPKSLQKIMARVVVEIPAKI